MQASSNAYKECDIYNRTIIQIEHENNDSSSYIQQSQTYRNCC